MADFESMGYHFCDTLLDYCDPDKSKVGQLQMLMTVTSGAAHLYSQSFPSVANCMGFILLNDNIYRDND